MFRIRWNAATPTSGLAVMAAFVMSCKDSTTSVEPQAATTPVYSMHVNALLPDLQTVVPDQLQIVISQQRELLRFSNGIANLGAGPLHIRPAFPLAGADDTQGAIQDVFDGDGNVVQSKLVSNYDFHPTHNHWHIDDVALYEIRVGAPNGALVAGGVKVTFCLIDWIKLEGAARRWDRAYWDCGGSEQGISVGWVDQYHHATDGQDLDITGLPAGLYYLVSTSNPVQSFIESDYTNNMAWVAFELLRDTSGKPRLRILNHSACDGGLCGSNANR